jgi:hypothetical protein
MGYGDMTSAMGLDAIDGRAILRPIAREQVYHAIDTERAYQNARWGCTPGETTGHNPHSVLEWLTYIKLWAEQGIVIAANSSKKDDPADRQALEFARKCAALGVVCMEQHGAPKREGY